MEVRTVLALAVLAACGSKPATTPPSNTGKPVENRAGQAEHFKIGELDAYALKDGDIDVANDGKTLGIGIPTTEVGDVLAAAGLPRERTELSIQPLLVKDGDHTLLFDTGVSVHEDWARGGRIFASLAVAGVAPGDITDIYVSHSHPDHIGNLLTDAKTLAFPNATIHMSAPEWEAMQKAPNGSKIAPLIAAKVVPFPAGTRLTDKIIAVDTSGHTPGHTTYAITSNDETLMYLGDVAHHQIVSLAHPEWPIEYDMDAKTAEGRRAQVLASLAITGVRVYSVHFPFPGLGHIRKAGAAFRWEPEVSPAVPR